MSETILRKKYLKNLNKEKLYLNKKIRQALKDYYKTPCDYSIEDDPNCENNIILFLNPCEYLTLQWLLDYLNNSFTFIKLINCSLDISDIHKGYVNFIYDFHYVSETNLHLIINFSSMIHPETKLK